MWYVRPRGGAGVERLSASLLNRAAAPCGYGGKRAGHSGDSQGIEDCPQVILRNFVGRGWPAVAGGEEETLLVRFPDLAIVLEDLDERRRDRQHGFARLVFGSLDGARNASGQLQQGRLGGFSTNCASRKPRNI